MNTDELIDSLARDTTPVRRLVPLWLSTVTWLVVSGLSGALLIVLLSPNLDRLANIRAPRFWLEQLAALTTGIAAAGAALVSIVPGHSRRAWLLPIVPLGAWMGIALWGCLRDWANAGSAGLVVHADWPCVLAMALGALVPAAALAFMARRGAPLAPRATAAFAGLAAAGLGSVAGGLSRPTPHGSTITMLVWHFGMLLVLTSAASWAGRYLLRWPMTTVAAVGINARR